MSEFFLSLVDSIGSSLTFGLFAAFSVIAYVWAWRRVPETKGRSLEQIQDLWEEADPVAASAGGDGHHAFGRRPIGHHPCARAAARVAPDRPRCHPRHRPSAGCAEPGQRRHQRRQPGQRSAARPASRREADRRRHPERPQDRAHANTERFLHDTLGTAGVTNVTVIWDAPGQAA